MVEIFQKQFIRNKHCGKLNFQKGQNLYIKTQNIKNKLKYFDNFLLMAENIYLKSYHKLGCQK